MIKVTLLGDSIRQNYGAKVPSILGNEFEIYQPEDNCRFSKYTLRGLFEWRNAMEGSRIVHWNNGLWDICNLYGDGTFTSEEEYIANMKRIADLLLERHEKVIFATTTPVTNENPYDSNEKIKRFNEIIVPVLKEKGVIINDLHALLSKDVYKYIRTDDNIHLTEAGIEACSKQVADLILKTAKELDDNFAPRTRNDYEQTAGAPVLL